VTDPTPRVVTGYAAVRPNAGLTHFVLMDDGSLWYLAESATDPATCWVRYSGALPTGAWRPEGEVARG